VPLPVAQAKSDDKQFWKIKVSCPANEKALNMQLMRGPVFSLGGEWVGCSIASLAEQNYYSCICLSTFST